MQIQGWSALKQGDIIDVVAPGYASKPEHVKKALNFLTQWGLQFRYPEQTIQKHFLHANSDEKRWLFLRQALLAKDSRVVWCLRGGYGSHRLIPKLQTLKCPSLSKLLIGISDITSLHLFLNQNWNWISLHAPLLDRLGQGLIAPAQEKELYNILFGKQTEVHYKRIRPLNAAALNVNQLQGRFLGGNLVVLAGHLGTALQMNPANKFIFIEEIGERAYRVDRLLEQMQQAGIWKKAKAIFLGDFLHCQEPDGSQKILRAVIKRWAEGLPVPVFSGLEAGHGDVQRPIPFLTKATVIKSASDKPIWNLQIETGVKVL